MDTDTQLGTGDPCYRILHDAGMSQDVKAAIRDDFCESPNAVAFAQQINRFGFEPSLKDALVIARRHSSASQRHQFVSAIHAMAAIDPEILANAERHPAVLKFLVGAAVREEKKTRHASAPHEESAEQDLADDEE